MPTQTCKLQTISVTDFCMIKQVDEYLNDAVTFIGGANAQGKTSLIKSIDLLLGGAKFLPADPVRKGADCAVVSGTISTPIGTISIRRVVTEVGGKPRVSTEVTGGKGMESGAPQRLLDSFVGAGSRDALKFLSMKPKEQVDELQRLLGLNFDAVNQKRQTAYDQRTVQNGVVDTLAKRFEGVQGVPAATPDAEVSAADLTKQLEAAAKHNAEGENLAERAEGLAKQLTDCDAWLETSAEEIKEAEVHIAGLIQQLDAKKARHAENAAKRPAVEKAALAAQKIAADFKPVDTTELNRQLSEVDEVNRNVRLKADLKKAKAEWEAAKKISNQLTDEITACDKEKRDRLAAVKMPVEGLSITEDGVLYNGIALESASSAEQRIVAIGLAFAADAELKVKSIRDGSLLDDEALKHVAELVVQHGGQLLIERVGYGAENTFILEGGEEIDADRLEQLRKGAA